MRAVVIYDPGDKVYAVLYRHNVDRPGGRYEVQLCWVDTTLLQRCTLPSGEVHRLHTYDLREVVTEGFAARWDRVALWGIDREHLSTRECTAKKIAELLNSRITDE